MTLSTIEAEYVALADTIKEAIFLRYGWRFILPGLGSACITVFEDNKGVRHLDHNPVCASNSKHIDIRHRFLRELVFSGEFDIVAVESEQQHANFFTKALAGPGFGFHRHFVMNTLFWTMMKYLVISTRSSLFLQFEDYVRDFSFSFQHWIPDGG